MYLWVSMFGGLMVALALTFLSVYNVSKLAGWSSCQYPNLKGDFQKKSASKTSQKDSVARLVGENWKFRPSTLDYKCDASFLRKSGPCIPGMYELASIWNVGNASAEPGKWGCGDPILSANHINTICQAAWGSRDVQWPAKWMMRVLQAGKSKNKFISGFFLTPRVQTVDTWLSSCSQYRMIESLGLEKTTEII